MVCFPRIVFIWDTSAVGAMTDPAFGLLPVYYGQFNTWLNSIHQGGDFFNGNVHHVTPPGEKVLWSCRSANGGASWSGYSPFPINVQALLDGNINGDPIYPNTLATVPPSTEEGEDVIAINVFDETHPDYTAPVEVTCNPGITLPGGGGSWPLDYNNLVDSYAAHIASGGRSRCVMFMLPTHLMASCYHMSHSAINLWAAYDCSILPLSPEAYYGLTVQSPTVTYAMCDCDGIDNFALTNQPNPYCPATGDLIDHGVILSIDFRFEAFTSIGKDLMDYFCPQPPGPPLPPASSPPKPVLSPAPPSPMPPPPSLINAPMMCGEWCRCEMPDIDVDGVQAGCFVHLAQISPSYPPAVGNSAGSKCACYNYRLSKPFGQPHIYNPQTGSFIVGTPTWFVWEGSNPITCDAATYILTRVDESTYEVEFTTACAAPPPSPPSVIDDGEDAVAALNQLVDSLGRMGIETRRENGVRFAVPMNCSELERAYTTSECCAE